MLRLGIDLTASWGLRDGMTTVARCLARALVDEGSLECVLFCRRARMEGFGADVEVVLSPYRRERFNKLGWLPFAEARSNLDAILYPHWPCPPLRSPKAPPALVFVHDLAFRHFPEQSPWQTRAYLGVVLPRALRQAARVLVPSETTRRDVLAAYPQRGLDARLRVVPEGLVPLPEGGPLPAGLQPGFLLAVGTVEPRKNYPRLVAAYGRLRERLPGTPPLVVAGRADWDPSGALEQLRRQPGVVFVGHVDDATLGALYRAAAALAFPSLYEGFGLPLLEAMSVGLPALIGSRGSLPELAGGAALCADPEDLEAIAEGLLRLLEDRELRQRLAAAGRERAQEFTWRRSAERTVATVRELAAGAGP